MKYVHSKETISSHEKIALINLIMHVLPQRSQCLPYCLGLKEVWLFTKKRLAIIVLKIIAVMRTKERSYKYKKSCLSTKDVSVKEVVRD